MRLLEAVGRALGRAGWQTNREKQLARASSARADTTKQGRAILAVADTVSTGNRTCVTSRFVPAKQGFSVIFGEGFALDTQDVLAYDGPVLKRFSGEFGPKLSSSSARKT